MTTAATVVGHFPLVLATGPGAGARNSIGIMLVTGMVIGSFFTLFVVPSIYMLLARTHRAEAPEPVMSPIATSSCYGDCDMNRVFVIVLVMMFSPVASAQDGRPEGRPYDTLPVVTPPVTRGRCTSSNA